MAGGAPLDSREICLLNFYLGSLSADACLEACRAAGIQPGDVDFVGSHGQTIWHEPAGADYLGRKVRATLQIGEPSLIAERLGCPVVSDFRVRDMAAGGLGAPLVPYTEYLLYREEHRTVALQNIGGIGNITVLPAGGALADTLAFDTGPGNMVIDALAARVTNGALRYDDGGKLARQGQVSAELLRYLVDSDDYLRLAPPKTTGREHYSAAFVDALWRKGEELGLTGYDKIATATAFTAESICLAVEHHCPQKPERLIVGGGGSHNPVLMGLLQAGLPGCEVVTNEALGLDSDAKEAVAFAILANEMLHGRCNNAPSATGAAHPVVMGKLSLMRTASQLAGTTAALLAAGLPVLNAMDIVSRVLDNRAMGRDLSLQLPRLEEGKPLAACLRDCPDFPDLLVEMTGVGEETGTLEHTLDVVSDYYDNETQLRAQKAVSLLEPAIICVLAVIVVAWGVGSVCGTLGTSTFIVESTTGTLSPALVPGLLFVIGAVISFAIGSSWGTMAILLPIGINMAYSFNLDFPLVIAAVLSGSLFGDHCSPISDTTIMSSMAAGCNHIEHVKTQLPYALVAAGGSFITYLIVGFADMSAAIALPIAIVVALVLYFLCCKLFVKKAA